MAPSEAARAAPARADSDPRPTEQLPGRLVRDKYHFLGDGESVIRVDIGATGAIADAHDDDRFAAIEELADKAASY